MDTKKILSELSRLGNENTKKTLMRHGAREPFYGVRIGDLKKIQKRLKKNHALALALFDTGNSDAMYLAALIADEGKMTPEDLTHWAQNAYWYMLSEYAVASVAAESRYGYELAKQWLQADAENIASAGWATLANLVSLKSDDELNIPEIDNYLDLVVGRIHESHNRVRYTMNGYVISVGVYIPALTSKALKVARETGKVSVDMGGTACKVPDAVDYINKVKAMNRTGRKRKKVR